MIKDSAPVKTALVTGSGSGIGRAVGLRLVRQGYALAVNDVNADSGNKVLSEIEQSGGQACFIHADVSNPDQVGSMFSQIKNRWGRLDVLVNNAGTTGTFSLLADMADEIWHQTIGVHLNGSFYCLREAARMMIPAGRGKIVNIASIAGLVGTVGSGEYSAAKAGVINLTRTAAKELAPYGITVNAVAPGIVATPVNLALEEKNSPFIQSAKASSATGRMTTPEEIAELVLFLISCAASNLTGQVIPLDGAGAITIPMDKFMQTMVGRRSQIVADSNKPKR
jgi:3-oxoacyl-[acyl-carrier protein] reductase